MSQNTLTALLQEILESFAHCQSISEMARSLTDIDLEQRLFAFQLLGEGLAIAARNHPQPTGLDSVVTQKRQGNFGFQTPSTARTGKVASGDESA